MMTPAQKESAPRRIRQLCYGDNLPFMREMDDESVDLIYLDPPFNSNRAYNIIYPNDKDAQATAFVDTWFWSQESDSLWEQVASRHIFAGKILDAMIGALGKCQSCAYLVNMTARLIEMHRILKSTGSLYLHCDPTASHYLKVIMDGVFGAKNFRNEIIWHYETGGVPRRDFSRKHDIILRYTKTNRYNFFPARIREPRSDEVLRRIATGIESATRSKGETRHPTDVFRIPSINAMAKERLGYPTQKPLALLERILMASSDEGDMVLDPFCGCGTAIHAAEKLGRQWIGIDIAYAAVGVIHNRFQENDLADIWKKVQRFGEPQTIEEVEARTLASEALLARKEFEIFCVGRLSGVANTALGADKGKDGFLRIGPGYRGIFSIKSGKVSVRDLRELKGVLSESEPVGIFVTKEPPTRDMIKFAKESGIWRGEGMLKGGYKIPRLQIITLEDILRGVRPAGFPLVPRAR